MSDDYTSEELEEFMSYDQRGFEIPAPNINPTLVQEQTKKYIDVVKKYLNKMGTPEDSVSDIFTKTSEEAASENISISQAAKEDSSSTGTGSPESDDLLKNIYTMAGTQFVQMFYDLYMSPLNSDIEYRLGKVTGTKVNFQNIGKFKSSSAFNGAQFDKYGRIDTTVNFRLSTHIDGLGNGAILGYDEPYVNWFFPPYNQSAFKSGKTLNEIATKDLTQRVWNNSHQCWEINGEEDTTTYDIANMMSCRPNPTYRLTAFKSVNDNIQWLQKIYENTTGIVSTYLTEWDLSLYIQEGLLEDARRYPVINMCYRILEDNPMGWSDTRAFSFGSLNAAVSKSPISGITPNTLDWNPADYPLSIYWTPYDSMDRGDGLDVFYDVALNGVTGLALDTFGYDQKSFFSLNLKNKIRFYDDVNAAYTGWTSYKGLKYFHILYSTEENSLNQLDMTHISEPLKRKKGETGLKLLDCIHSVISANYDIDPSLGYDVNEPRILMDEKPKKLIGMRNRWVYRKKNIITGEWEECGAKITPRYLDFIPLYWQMPVKGLIFTPKWKIVPFPPFIGIPKKASELSNVNAAYSGLDVEDADSAHPKIKSPNGSDDGALERSANGFYKVPSIDSPESYADHFGISQRSPALYGGPHGKYSSPKTIQAYFEEQNSFLRDVPRVDSGFETSMDYTRHFIGNNGFYSFPCDESIKFNPSRSPSYALALLKNGVGAKKIQSQLNSQWELSKVEIQNVTFAQKPQSRWYGRIISNIVAYFSPWKSQFKATVKSKEVYRLKILGPTANKISTITRVVKKTKITAPYSLNPYRPIYNSIEMISKSWGLTSQEYSVNEVNFARDILGVPLYSTGMKIRSPWKSVFLFQNNSPEERVKFGPNMIFEVPCRVNSYTYSTMSTSPWHWVYMLLGWTGIFTFFKPIFSTRTANYIEVDAEYADFMNRERFWHVWSGFNTSLNTFSNLGTKSDSAADIPNDSYRTLVASSPWVYEQQATSSIFTFVQDFIGQSKNTDETCIFGYGLTTGFRPLSDDKKAIGKLTFEFEDGVYADEGLRKALTNLYTTSTFYKTDSNEAIYARPCIVQNDVPFRVFVKNSLHQVAWLKQAKESFIDNVDFAEVMNIIKSSVEPSIISASQGKNYNDVNYSYWIDKALNIFSQDKAAWGKKFDTVIAAFDAINTSFKDKISMSALNWSYSDFNDAFKLIETAQTGQTEISEFMTAYLHVLYEYRKYFINKRFNKVGGTMISMRHLEDVIPMIVNTKTEPKNKKLDSVDTLPINIGTQEYPVAMYEVSNSNSEKVKAAAKMTEALEPDRTKTIYVKVEYAKKAEVDEYIQKLRNGETIPNDEHLMYIGKNDKWAKLPISGMYQYISKEWERNDKARVWNLTCNKGSERYFNEDITNCIFDITWCPKTDKVAYSLLNGVDTSLQSVQERYSYIVPYSYSETATGSIPHIKFGVTNGINLDKMGDVASALGMSNATPLDLVCTTRDVDDFWQIQIPTSEMPLTTGYKTKLKIKTYNPNPAPSISQETLAGPMTFTIWPITEDQVDVTPGIGVNMTKQAEELRRTRTSIDTGVRQ